MPADYFSLHAARDAARDALLFEGQRWRYAALDDAADRLVAVLRALGVGPEDRVAYLGKNSPMFFVALIAAIRAGGVFVPINWRNAAPETGYILDDSRAKLLLAEGAFLAAARQASGAQRPIVAADGDDPAGLSARIAAAAPAARRALDPDAPALQLYTSGTTGRPKGVLTSQRKLGVQRDAERASGALADWADDEVLLSALPCFHIGGLSWTMTGLARGQTVVLTNDTTPAGLLGLCREHGVTRAFLVPSLLRAVLDQMAAQEAATARLRGVHYGAAPMDAALLERAVRVLGCAFLQYYGMTEATGTVAMLTPADHDLARPDLLRSVGRASPGCAIEIRDLLGRPVAPGEAGEIWVRAPGVMIGYANLPEATAEVLQDGWYRTGDGGRLDPAGLLYLTDRIKDTIVSGGENVYPAEVEAALRLHPSIQDCAVFGLPHEIWGESVCVAIQLNPGTTLTLPELVAFARDMLAGYKIPRRIALVPLPRTASGKVQRRQLRQRVLAQDVLSAPA